MQYYLEREQSGYVGNCLLWWRSGHCGYTCDLGDAQIFDECDPRFVGAMKSGKYRARACAYIETKASHHVDHQRLDLRMGHREQPVFPHRLREAVASDIVDGQIIYYKDGDNGPFFQIVQEIMNPNDPFKAYVATDGCRYGLDGAYVEDCASYGAALRD